MVSRKGRIAFKALVVGVLFLSIFLAVFVLAAIIITTSSGGTGFSVNQSVNSNFNITVNNTNVGAVANITQVNVTLLAGPSCVFVAASNGSDSVVELFANTTTVLSWSNTTVYLVNGSLVGGGVAKYFWFNMSCATPGSYNITVTTTNFTNSYSSNLTLQVNDTTIPNTLVLVSPTPAANSNNSRNFMPINVTSTDNVNISTVRIYLYNSSGLVNSTNLTGPANYYFANITGLLEGLYYINMSANDTSGNVNSTSETRTVRLDTTGPTVALPVYTNATLKRNTESLILNVSVVDVSNGDKCLIDVNGTNQTISVSNGWCNSSTIFLTGLTDGNKTIKVWVNDTAGNSAFNNSYAVQIDTTAPTVTINAPTSGQIFTTRLVLLNVTISENGTCLYSIDAGVTNGSMENADNRTYTKASVLSNANYVANFYCNDTLGSLNSTENVSFTVAVASTADDSSSSGAGEAPIYSASDSVLEKGYTVSLGKDFGVSFSVGGTAHSLKVKSISGTGVVVIISSNPVTLELSVGETKKVDVNGDGTYDLSVYLKEVSSLRIKLVLTSINEVVESSGSGAESDVGSGDEAGLTGDSAGEGTTDKEGFNMVWVWVLVGVIVLVVILSKTFVGKRKR